MARDLHQHDTQEHGSDEAERDRAERDGAGDALDAAGGDHVPASEEPGTTDPPPGTAVSARTHAEGTVGSDLRFFERAEPGSLRDQRDLIDEDGDDIRMYTGEPVETDDGWILPQQQNQPGNSAGGGEYPDPDTPSTQPGKPTGERGPVTERPEEPDRVDGRT